MLVAAGVSVPLLLAVALAFGVCDAVFEPSVTTLSRQLVREEDLAAYTGAGQTASRLGTMLGAALGGGLVAFGGLTATAAESPCDCFSTLRHPYRRCRATLPDGSFTSSAI